MNEVSLTSSLDNWGVENTNNITVFISNKPTTLVFFIGRHRGIMIKSLIVRSVQQRLFSFHTWTPNIYDLVVLNLLCSAIPH